VGFLLRQFYLPLVLMMVVMTVMVAILSICRRRKYSKHHYQREHRQQSAFNLHKVSPQAASLCEAAFLQ
jgi:hypothetical protein